MGEYEMISVIDYGAGNIQSVIKAFHHIGCEVQVTADREVIKASDAAILPGVGAFGDSMNCLKNAGLVQPVLDFIESGKPFLGICLGLQLLFEGSEESPGGRCLGVLEGEILRIPADRGLKVPHIGWTLQFSGETYLPRSSIRKKAGGLASRCCRILSRGSTRIEEEWHMYAKRIIPCLDVNNGRVVKGTNFVNLRDAGDPVEAAKAYDAQGADELVFLDITASAQARNIILDMVAQVADSIFIPFTVGGGIRTVDDFNALLRAGADKVSVNSAAIRNPSLIQEAAEKIWKPVRGVRNRCKAPSGRRLDGLFKRRPGRYGSGCRRMGETGSRSGGGGDFAHQHGLRRRQKRLRFGIDAGGVR